MLIAGWEWEQLYRQTADTVPLKFWQLRFKPFSEGQTFLDQEINIMWLYYNRLILDIPRFKFNPFFSATVTGDGNFCYGFGYDTQKIKFSLLMSHQFMDCSKQLLKDLCDFSTNWTGYDSKWLENCGNSENVQIQLFQYTAVKAAQNVLWWGTANPVSKTNCYQLLPPIDWNNLFPALTVEAPAADPAPAAAAQQMLSMLTHTLYTNLWNYLENEYEFEPVQETDQQ